MDGLSSTQAPPRARTSPALEQIDVPEAGRSRVILENLTPMVDNGRFPAKRSVGETVRVEVDAFTDGHDKISVALRHRVEGAGDWTEVDMAQGVNDRWHGDFAVHALGYHEFTVYAWVDHFATWRYDFQKRVNAGQDVRVDLQIGAKLVREAAEQAKGDVAQSLGDFARILGGDWPEAGIEAALGGSLANLMRRHAPRKYVKEWPCPARLWVDPVRARFSSWYELFPRSASPDPSRHGTFKDVENRLDYVQRMGFDVLYLPPIHPIGRQHRKGRNNSTVAEPGDVGSPWAIGGPEGGHDAVHPQLGTIDDFAHLVQAARSRGIDIAMDLAFQCSPDHPYVREHPEWFVHRPDGTIQYAENPPKKYQDIYPFDFECAAWESLWRELLRVTLFWVDKGVRIFRVDNPHTKAFPFWEWMIGKVKEHNPEVLFLAEAFTRPKVMYRLAKLGFSQSYTYFAWRNEPWSIKQYFAELASQPAVDFFRPNAWPNTPDILNEYLQSDARAAYVIRAVLAATLCANYGVYGPAFELMEHRPVRPGSEEYLDSEKYQIRQWNLDNPYSLADLLSRLNAIRKDNPALQQDRTLVFHHCDNPSVVCYSKRQGNNAILVAVNTDPHHTQWSRLWLDTDALGIPEGHGYQVHDLLTNARYRWQGREAYVGLDPGSLPAHVFAIRKHARTEHDFDYFM
jgi:starch synthase (maltosyl-transferring)